MSSGDVIAAPRLVRKSSKKLRATAALFSPENSFNPWFDVSPAISWTSFTVGGEFITGGGSSGGPLNPQPPTIDANGDVAGSKVILRATVPGAVQVPVGFKVSYNLTLNYPNTSVGPNEDEITIEYPSTVGPFSGSFNVPATPYGDEDYYTIDNTGTHDGIQVNTTFLITAINQAGRGATQTLDSGIFQSYNWTDDSTPFQDEAINPPTTITSLTGTIGGEFVLNFIIEWGNEKRESISGFPGQGNWPLCIANKFFAQVGVYAYAVTCEDFVAPGWTQVQVPDTTPPMLPDPDVLPAWQPSSWGTYDTIGPFAGVSGLAGYVPVTITIDPASDYSGTSYSTEFGSSGPGFLPLTWSDNAWDNLQYPPDSAGQYAERNTSSPYLTGTVTITPVCDICDLGPTTIYTPVCPPGSTSTNSSGGSNSSSGSSGSTACVDFCQQLGGMGTFTSAFDGVLYLQYNDVVGQYGDNTGSFTVVVNGTSYTINGTDTTGVGIAITAGVNYVYVATGYINDGIGGITGPNGYAGTANGPTSPEYQCPEANFGSLMGTFICGATLPGSSSDGGCSLIGGNQSLTFVGSANVGPPSFATTNQYFLSGANAPAGTYTIYYDQTTGGSIDYPSFFGLNDGYQLASDDASAVISVTYYNGGSPSVILWPSEPMQHAPGDVPATQVGNSLTFTTDGSGPISMNFGFTLATETTPGGGQWPVFILTC